MGTNHHTAWAASATQFTAASMNPALAALDKAITYHKVAMVSCDGAVSWSGGTLTWGGTIHIYFTREDGTAIHNSIAASNIALADDEFCYVTLSETNDAALTMAKAAVGDGSASAFKAYNILVLGFRNAADDQFYPEELAGVFAASAAAGAYVQNSTFNANTILKADTDDTPEALEVTEQTLVGRVTGGEIAALTATQARSILNVEDGADVTDATNVAAAGAVMEADFNANTILAANVDDTPAALEIAEQRIVGRKTGGNITGLTGAEVSTILEQVSTLNFIIDGGGSAITTGQKGHIVVDFACTILAWTLLADQSGAIKIDVWKDTYANFAPTDADTICNSHEPEIAASGAKAQDTDLSDWGDVTVDAGDVLAFNVDSCATITRCTIALKVKRT